MKKTLALAALLSGMIAHVGAITTTFTPNDGYGDPNDIGDLDHAYYYTWGVKGFSIPQGQVITEAVLTITDINNWSATENGNNWLRMYLLDTAENPFHYGSEEASGPSGRLQAYWDNGGVTDNLAGLSWTAKSWIGTYTDYSGGDHGDVVTLTYNFSTLNLLDELTAYISNGSNFGLGFDPDCHYYNTGVTFAITTSDAPPTPPSLPDGGATAGLLVMGLGILHSVKRRVRA